VRNYAISGEKWAVPRGVPVQNHEPSPEEHGWKQGGPRETAQGEATE